MARLDAFLQLGSEQGCSDVHLAVGRPPMLRLHGELVPVKYRDLGAEELESMVEEILTDAQWGEFSVGAIDRVINVFPASEQPRIRIMLSTSLRGVISQQLVRRSDGKGRLAALEILINNAAAANIIREGKTSQLAGVIERGALQGMHSLDHALWCMLAAKLITGDEAYRKAVKKADFEQFREQEVAI